VDHDIDALVARLTVEEKAALVAGHDLWHTPGAPRLDVPGLRVTDGPNGARGPRWTGVPSACMPCGTALGATWDPELVERVGVALAQEAHTKGAHVLLAPTVNLHRHPLAGRNFECYSEDPYLSARLAVAFVRGVQSQGIATTVKHFVANDSEFERMTISSEVDERTLRELNLVPFEAAVRDGGAWGIMSAYNRLNGTYCAEHEWLLTTVLRDEWGFDGFVISDWYGTHSTGESANAGLDLEMPGPPQWFGAKLADAVASGAVAESTLDAMAGRVLTVAARTRALDGVGGGDAGSVDDPAHRALAREAAAASFVLLRNEDDILPLAPATLGSVALIGTAADTAWIMGGGSASLDSHPAPTPREGLAAALGDDVELRFARGPVAANTLPVLGRRQLDGPATVEYFANTDLEGPAAFTEALPRYRLLWMGAWTTRLDPDAYSLRITGTLAPDEAGEWTFGLTCVGPCRVILDGTVIVDAWDGRPKGDSFFGFGSEELRATVALEAGRRYALVIEYSSAGTAYLGGLQLGAAPPEPADALDHAVEVARAADVAVVVVGTGPELDCEGQDRPNMDLPGRQDEMVRAVAAANPRTVVCVNAGSPVSMDWADDVAAVLQCWLPGEEWGHALADVLLGDREPGGRLPTSFPVRLEDSPAHATYPGADGKVEYREGVLMGYRGFDASGTAPRFCFGHGLAYTSFEYGDAVVDGTTVSVAVTNTGARRGAEVVQAYVHPADAPVVRPEQELKAFRKVTLDPGETETVAFVFEDRAFAYWSDGWVVAPGAYEVRIGRSSRDIRTRATVHRGS
jgi:beta-glucosidase